MPKIVMTHSVMAGTCHFILGNVVILNVATLTYGFRYKIFFSPIKLSVYLGDVMVLISGQDEINRLLDIVNSFKISSAK